MIDIILKDDFMSAYIEAMFFTDGGPDDGDELRNVDQFDFSDEALQQIMSDCALFEYQAGVLLDGPCNRGGGGYSKRAQAGHDFWLTRNGHGAGFWDGDWPETGDALTALCKEFGETWPYVGDDGKIYF